MALAKGLPLSRSHTTTVSRWLNTFTQHTGFLVVTHTHHESVTGHLRAEAEEKRQQGDAAEHCDDGSAE